jgi:hypothetical protein
MEQFHDAAMVKPREYTSVRVVFSDGSIGAAVWTGLIWWGLGDAVTVVRWQELPMPMQRGKGS